MYFLTGIAFFEVIL